MTTGIINFIFKSPIFHVEKENYSGNYAITGVSHIGNGVSLVWNLKQTDTTIPTWLFTRQTPKNLKGLAE